MLNPVLVDLGGWCFFVFLFGVFFFFFFFVFVCCL